MRERNGGVVYKVGGERTSLCRHVNDLICGKLWYLMQYLKLSALNKIIKKNLSSLLVVGILFIYYILEVTKF